MNKRANPFYPPPAAPAGPHQPYAVAQAAQPPAAAQQYNYAGYWAQAQQYQQQAQWAPHPPAAPPPPAPPAAPPAAAADHAALYANYGYGPQHTWTQPAQVQPGHQPQQQSAIPIPYSTPYAAAPAAVPQAPPAVPAYVPQQPQYHPAQPTHQGYRPPGPPAPVHHAPPPHLPPAKRPRLGGPPAQQQPRFHPPAPPAGPHNRNGPPQQAPQQTGPGVNQTPLGGGRGGGSFGNTFLHANLGGGRGGGPRGGGPMRGGPPGHMGRGGMRGRGGGAFGGGARLGPPPSSAPMRGAPRGPGAMNRRQRPAANGQQIHRSAPGQGRGGGPSKQSNHPADRNQFSNSNSPSKAKNANAAAKRTEPQRTFTDFRLVGLKMRGNPWSWGAVPQDEVEAVSNSEAVTAGQDGQSATENAKTEATSSQQPPLTPQAAGACRIRIYFHNPKINGEAVGPGPSSPTVARAGKRKKMDDDDDVEFESEQRARQRPPPGFALKKESSFADTGSGEASVRGSLFGDGDGDSVTRREMSISASHAGTEEPEEDWLMAAIADGSGAAADADVAAAGGHAHASATTLPNAGASTDPSAPVAPVDADGFITVAAAVPPAGVAIAADPSTAPEEHAVQPGLDTDAGAADNSLISSLYDAPPTHEASAPDVPAAQTTESALVSASSVPVSGSPSASAAATAVASDHGVDATTESALLATSEVDHDDSLPVEETEMDVSAEYGQDAGSMFSPSSHLDDHASAVDDASVMGADASTNVGDQSILVMDDSAIGWSRLSVTYAGGAKRLVFDSAVVQKMTIHRAEGRINIDLKVEKIGEGPALQGIILETLVNAASQEYEAMSWATVDDITIPPFATLESPSNITLVAYLDRDKPLATPKWLKTGDLQEWLKVSLGKAAAVPGEDSWIGRIEVADPDPPPSIHTVLDTWARSSSVGNQAERLAFVDEHMKDVRNILEILLRLVRSDRAGPFNPRTEQQSAPLAAAIPHGSGLANHQTHITLAILAVYKLAEDQALSAGTLATLTSHIGEIVRCIPQHLIHKSLDAIYGAKIGVVVPTTNGKKQGK